LYLNHLKNSEKGKSRKAWQTRAGTSARNLVAGRVRFCTLVALSAPFRELEDRRAALQGWYFGSGNSRAGKILIQINFRLLEIPNLASHTRAMGRISVSKLPNSKFYVNFKAGERFSIWT
jgi:hypothetical protein